MVPSSSTNFTLYLFFVDVYVAVYTASFVTSSMAGLHPANVYVNSSVAAFTGSAGFTISAAAVPYSYSVSGLSTVVPSSSTNFTLYLFFAGV